MGSCVAVAVVAVAVFKCFAPENTEGRVSKEGYEGRPQWHLCQSG